MNFQFILDPSQHYKIDITLKMTKAEVILQKFLSMISNANFCNIIGEFKEIECNSTMTQFILEKRSIPIIINEFEFIKLSCDKTDKFKVLQFKKDQVTVEIRTKKLKLNI